MNTCIIITAHTGDVRAARSVALKALRKVGVLVGRDHFRSSAAMRHDGATRGSGDEPRYFVETTEAQYAAFEIAANEIAAAAGFDRTPLDCYKD